VITHSFAERDSLASGGTWFDDFGRVICKWIWNYEAKVLTVTCGSRGQRIELSRLDAQSLEAESLRNRLPRLAIEAAERTNDTRYDF
jgi:hypothetical protein